MRFVFLGAKFLSREKNLSEVNEMFIKPEDVEYILHDFLEIRYGTNELDNARIVRFLMERLRPKNQFALCPIYGFLADGILVTVVSIPGRTEARESLMLNKKTGKRVHYQQMSEGEKLTW